jgi:DNA-binding transcriptional LysR family regulator
MADEPSWDHYRTFLAVMRCGSLSAAARELGLSQPTIGRHVEALEQTVHGELFTRSQLGLLPTELAVTLRPYAETIATSSSALLRAASGERDKVSGTVRISASEMIGVEVLPPILAGLQDVHPALTIELSASDQVEDLLRREADIAVRMVEPSQDALIVRRIGDIPLGFFAHRRYLDRPGTPENLADLARHRLIGFDRQTAYIRSMIKRYPDMAHIAFSFRTDHSIAGIEALRAGMGIGFCQVGVARRNPELVRVLPDRVEILLGTWIAMHENLKASPRCRVAFDALVKGLLAYVGGEREGERQSRNDTRSVVE